MAAILPASEPHGRPTGLWHSRWAVIGLFGCIAAAALWLRLEALGRTSFDVDEYLHVFAGQSLLQGHGPKLPSGIDYTRALPYTQLVAGSFSVFGVSEVSARLPSVAFGMLLILLTYAVGRAWFGPWAGLVAAALVAIFPTMVETSRMCRMYAPFQCFYLLTVFACERGLERPGLLFRARSGWTAMGIFATLAGLKMQQLMVDFGPAVLAYWILLAAWTRQRRYWWFLGGVVAAVGLGAATGVVDLATLWREAHYVPRWALSYRYYDAYYIDLWRTAVPWIWWATPAAVVAAIAWHRARGAYVSCHFVIPFLLHSLLFGWKHARYVSHLIPLWALLVAPLLVRVAQAAWTWMTGHLGRHAGIGMAVAAAAVACGPTLVQARASYAPKRQPYWQGVYRTLAPEVRPTDVLIASLPLPALYYLGRLPAYTMSNYQFDYVEKVRMQHGTDGLWKEWYAGRPLLTSAAEFEQVRTSHQRGWIVSDRDRFTSAQATPVDLQAEVRRTCPVQYTLDDGRVLVFGWDDMSPAPMVGKGAR